MAFWNGFCLSTLRISFMGELPLLWESLVAIPDNYLQRFVTQTQYQFVNWDLSSHKVIWCLSLPSKDRVDLTLSCFIISYQLTFPPFLLVFFPNWLQRSLRVSLRVKVFKQNSLDKIRSSLPFNILFLISSIQVSYCLGIPSECIPEVSWFKNYHSFNEFNQEKEKTCRAGSSALSLLPDCLSPCPRLGGSDPVCGEKKQLQRETLKTHSF